jgi:hypothetical protein
MLVTTADVPDGAGALSMIGYETPNLSKCLKVLVHGGYSGESFAIKVKELIGAEVEVVKLNELHKATSKNHIFNNVCKTIMISLMLNYEKTKTTLHIWRGDAT